MKKIYNLERCACPGPGSCAGLFTANTMACITEAIGMSLPYCAATTHAVAGKKIRIARESGEQILNLIKNDITPSKIMTTKCF